MLRKLCVALFIIGSTLELTGCASNASADKMVYLGPSAQKPAMTALTHNVGVSDISGGKETNPLWSSKINNANFKLALEQSLRNAKLYHTVNGGKYQLDAKLLKLDQPFLGLDLKVDCLVHYTLHDSKTNKVIFDKDISSTYTATFSDSAIAIERLKIANEGAARENIKQLINDLYRL